MMVQPTARTVLDRRDPTPTRSAPAASLRRAGRSLLGLSETLWGSRPWVALAALPAVALLALVGLYGVDLPWHEEWSMTALVSGVHRGELELVDLWQLQNGHRPLVPRLLLLLAARLSGWNVRLELLLNLALAAGVCVVLVRCLVTEPGLGGFTRRRRRGLVPLVSLLVFSLTQVDNFTWGWQIRIFLNLFAVVLGAALLLGPVRRRWRLVGAMVMGWIASYSFSTGLVYWVALLPLATRPGPWREPRRTLWLSSAATCWLSIVPLAGETAPHLTWSPLRLVSFTASALGSPLFPHALGAAFLAGAAGVLGLLYLALRLLGRTHRPRARAALLAWLSLGSYAVGAALLTALGRSHLGAARALNGSSLTIATLFWVTIVVLVLRWSENGDQPELARRRWIVPVLLLVTALVAWRSLGEAYRFPEQYRLRRGARQALLVDPSLPELSRLHSDTNVVRRARFVLERYGLSCFRRAGSESNEETP